MSNNEHTVTSSTDNRLLLVSSNLEEALAEISNDTSMICDNDKLEQARELVDGKFPVTKNFMTILYNRYPSPNREMKQNCYIASILTTHLRKEKNDEYNDYDHDDMNRFVAALLVKTKNRIAFVGYDKQVRKRLKKDMKINKNNYDSFFKQIIDTKIPNIDVNYNSENCSFDHFVRLLKAYRNCLCYAVGHPVLQLKKNSTSTKDEIHAFTRDLVTQFDEIMTPMFTAVAATREFISTKRQGISKYSLAPAKSNARLDLDLGIWRQQIWDARAITDEARNRLPGTTLVICPTYFHLDTVYSPVLIEDNTKFEEVLSLQQSPNDNLHYWARYGEVLRSKAGGGNLLTMSYKNGDGLVLKEDCEQNYKNCVHRHCEGNLNHGRLMISLHTKYSNLERLKEIFVEHPKNTSDDYLEKVLGATFFKSTIIGFLTSGILQPGGKIYLPFHPYILKQLYHFNDGDYYKITFEKGDGNLLQESHKKWVATFTTEFTNMTVKQFSLENNCECDPNKEFFESFFPKNEKKSQHEDAETIDQSYFYDMHWRKMPDKNFHELRWILLTATNNIPTKIVEVTRRDKLDEAISDDDIGCTHPYTEEESEEEEESSMEDDEDDYDAEDDDEDDIEDDEDSSGVDSGYWGELINQAKRRRNGKKVLVTPVTPDKPLRKKRKLSKSKLQKGIPNHLLKKNTFTLAVDQSEGEKNKCVLMPKKNSKVTKIKAELKVVTMENDVVVIKGLDELFNSLESEATESNNEIADIRKRGFCIMLPRRKGNNVLIPYTCSGQYWEDNNSTEDQLHCQDTPPPESRRVSQRILEKNMKKKNRRVCQIICAPNKLDN